MQTEVNFTYNGWGIVYNGEASWSFGNGFARHVLIFGVDDSSSYHTDNGKNNFLVFGEGPTQGINDSAGAAEKKIGIDFSKANTKSCLRLHYNGDESDLHVNKTEICKVKAKDNISWSNFCLGSVSQGFTKDEQSESSLNSTAYDFLVEHSSIKGRRHS